MDQISCILKTRYWYIP